jgi:hypothetical protein
MWKRSPSLLPHQIPGAQLLHLLNLWQSPHHIFSSQSPESPKIWVAELRMPKPSTVRPLCHQIHQLSDFHGHHIQPIGRVLHHCQWPLQLIMNSHHARFDQHFKIELIQLPKTHNVHGQLGN